MVEQLVAQLDDETFGPNSYNPCSYVYNNPINMIDPSGLIGDTVTTAIENCLKRPTPAAT